MITATARTIAAAIAVYALLGLAGYTYRDKPAVQRHLHQLDWIMRDHSQVACKKAPNGLPYYGPGC